MIPIFSTLEQQYDYLKWCVDDHGRNFIVSSDCGKVQYGEAGQLLDATYIETIEELKKERDKFKRAVQKVYHLADSANISKTTNDSPYRKFWGGVLDVTRSVL